MRNGTMRALMKRFGLVVLVAMFGAGSLTPGRSDAAAPGNLEELRQQRKEAAHRKRRIIYNNDGDDLTAFIRDAKDMTPDEFLARRTSAVAGTQVDTIFYCTGLCFGILRYDSKLGDNLVRRALEADKLPRDKTEQFLAKKLDPMQMIVDFCRRNKIEVFCSMRMNDTHDGRNPLLFSTFKKNHPECLNGTAEKPPKYGVWTAVDYARPEVRDLRVRMFQEACENYDLDGIEMDFFRHSILFKSHADGAVVSPQERDLMTDMVRRIRRMTEEVGLKRGRPILVAVRVPDSVGYCEATGLDLARWLDEGLLDILIPGGYFRLNPWETSVELGHRHGVPVYPSLDESRMQCKWPDPSEAGKIRNTPACFRARAAEVWDSGADGVYMFNLFDPRSPLWSELGDPKTLQGLDAVYTTGARGAAGIAGRGNGFPGGERFLNRLAFCPERPLKLVPGRAATVDLRVGQQIVGAESRGHAPKVTLRLRVKDLPDADELAVKLNGQALTGPKRQDAWLDYPVQPTLVVKGTNRFEIALALKSAAKPTLEDLLLWVRYGKDR